MYGYVWLSRVMYGYVGLYEAMHGYVGHGAGYLGLCGAM